MFAGSAAFLPEVAACNACSSRANCFCSCAISFCKACTVALAALLPELLDDDAPPPAEAPAWAAEALPPCADEVVAVDDDVVVDADDADAVAVVAPAILTGMAEVSR